MPIYGPSLLLLFYGDVHMGPSTVLVLRVWMLHLSLPMVLVWMIAEHIHNLHLDSSTQGLYDVDDYSSVKVYGCVLWLDILGTSMWIGLLV